MSKGSLLRGVPKEKLHIILNMLQKRTKIQANGAVAFESSMYQSVISILLTWLEFSDAIPEADRRGMIVEALSACAKQGGLVPDKFIADLNVRELAFKRRIPTEYVLATTLSVKSIDLLQSDSLAQDKVTLYRTFPDSFDRSYFNLHPNQFPYEPTPPGFSAVSIRVKARSPDAAFELALDRLDCLRGIWNYSINSNRLTSSSSGPQQQPINMVRLGPVHTLHSENGGLVKDGIWTEPLYSNLGVPTDLHATRAGFRGRVKGIRRLMAASTYRQTLEMVFIKYVRAFDQADYDASYLKLWSLLEYMTGNDSKYDLTIKKCSFIFDDIKFTRIVLEHLRDQRNKTVHTGTGAANKEWVLFQLKYYVEHLMRFHLGARRNFQNLSDAVEFLDLSPDPNQLRKTIQRCRRGIKLRIRKPP